MVIILLCKYFLFAWIALRKNMKILKLKGYFEAIIQMTDRLMAKREKTKDKQWPT